MLVDWLIRRAKRTPYFHLEGYMLRWWMVPYNTHAAVPITRPIAWLMQRFNISARIHEILRSDLGRHPHDHPFNYLTVILRGWYIERRYNDAGEIISAKMHGPGSVLFRRAGSWHKLQLVTGPVTTLFITGRKESNAWGFNVDGVKVPHKRYA